MLERGTVLNNKWEILAHIATGGKGEVYRAKQRNLERDVAIKIISPGFIESLEEDEEEMQSELARFKREVLAMAQTHHPNILQVYDYDMVEIEGREFEYIAMEYVPGSTLRQTMPREGFGQNEQGLREWLTRYFFPVLDGMEAIHQLGIVHRDIKPENILLDGEVPKIADFGLVGGKQWEPITRSHHSLGTLIYMAPEQFTDMDLTDARADIYALGKILYEAVAGKMEKRSSFPMQTAQLPHADTDYLKRVDRVIQQATDKNPSDRTPSVKELRRVLERTLTSAGHSGYQSTGVGGSPVSGGTLSKWPIFMIITLVILLMAGAWYHFRGFSENPKITGGGSQPSAEAVNNRITTPDWGQIDKTPGATYSGEDGAVLRFVPGGEFLLKETTNDNAGTPVKVDSFFMDENEVTNHQYVEFLNENLSEIQIERNIVKAAGAIWLFIGEIQEGYEPIVFEDGMFKVSGPEHASYPVVRVTGYGAGAYARYYGRRLPTVNEWLHAVKTRHVRTDVTATETPAASGLPEQDSFSTGTHTMMHGAQDLPKSFDVLPGPIGETPGNDYSIRGLDANVSEWAADPDAGGQERFFVMGGLGEPRAEPASQAIERYPWEAFGTVGFRTLLSVTKS